MEKINIKEEDIKFIRRIGIRVRELLQINNIGIYQLASKSGVSPSTLYSIINYQQKNIRTITIALIARSFDLTLKEFYNSPIFI